MSSIAIQVDGIGKRYRISHQAQSYGRLTESLTSVVLAPLNRIRGKQGDSEEWFWALDDVSFQVSSGDVLGVVGRNGAGKSTLLKVLSRITEPTTGSATLVGRVASLLEVGTGFHPELSGRENIYLSGSILGMTRQETASRFDEIVEFADIGPFLDTPVKRYSSGMSVRLGFAVAAHLETEILIVDEVLAVGDAGFQKKCLAKMGDVAGAGRTILFVSHNMAAVESLCDRAILLHKGKIAGSGTATDIVSEYSQHAAALGQLDLATRKDRQGSGLVRFTAVRTKLRTGADSSFDISFEAERPVQNVDVSIALFTHRGEGAANLFTAASGDTFEKIEGTGTITCELPRLALLPGQYRINLFCSVNGEVADWVMDAATIDVGAGDFYGTGKVPPSGYGSVLVDHAWTVRGRS